MADEISDVFAISGSALQAQNQRMKIIAENIANANNSPSAPGAKPYQRQVISFKSEFDKALGAYKVKAGNPRNDTADFVRKYDPSNPVADKQGYVLMPNVNPLVEMMDMSDANRAYQSNLGVIDISRSMILHTISLLQ
jgi:flagellar basal-body rod protein FlgC